VDDPRLAQIIMSVREGALQVSRALGYRGGSHGVARRGDERARGAAGAL
jgi:hypothetical protein